MCKATWRVQTVAVKMLLNTTQKQLEAFRRCARPATLLSSQPPQVGAGAMGALKLGAWCCLLRLKRGTAPGREVFILEDLKDANIVQFLGACFEEGSTMLVTGEAC